MWKAYDTTFDTISTGKEGNFEANVFVRRARWAPSYLAHGYMVAGGLEIDALEGGSVAPGGPLPDDLSYTCHAAEEHAPIRAHISTK